MQHLRLSSYERSQLIKLLHSTLDARVHRRALILLEIDSGKSAQVLAEELRVNRGSIYYCIKKFKQDRECGRRILSSLSDHPGRGRKSVWSGEMKAELKTTLRRRPDELGYFAVTWTVSLLREHLKKTVKVSVSDATLRRELHRLGFRWKRPRYKLIPDPEFNKKKPNPEGVFEAFATVSGFI